MPNEIKVEKTIYELLQEVRYEMTKISLKKSGYNKHLNFNYFELADFLPTATKLFYEKGLCPIFSIAFDPSGVETAILRIYHGSEVIQFSMPTAEPTNMQGIQAAGAKKTYLRRYLYMDALDLTENDQIDASLDEESKNAQVAEKKATEKQVEMIKSLYDEENQAKMLEYYKIEKLEDLSIKDASALIKRKKG